MTTRTFNLPGIQRWSKLDVGPYLESDIAESAISLEANERRSCLIGLLEKADLFFEVWSFQTTQEGHDSLEEKRRCVRDHLDPFCFLGYHLLIRHTFP